jgi:MFS family permease
VTARGRTPDRSHPIHPPRRGSRLVAACCRGGEELVFSAYRAVAALLVAIGLSVAGNGLVAISLPLAAEAAGWSPLWLGLIGSAYFTGMLIGASASPPIIRAVGYDRAYMAVVALVTAVVIGFSVSREPIAWIVFRGVMGFSYAVLYSIVESWLQGSSDNATRGQVLGFYSVVQNAGSAVGNQSVSLAVPGDSLLFELAAIAIVLSIVPIAVSSAVAPPRPARPTMPLRLVWRQAPVGLVGVFLIGVANGPFWALMPVYVSGLGFTPGAVGTFMTAVVIGAALAQLPVGTLSDRFDRRKVLVGLLVANTVLDVFLGAVGGSLPGLAVGAVGFLLGGTVATQYYVVIAHVNDRTGRDNVVGIAALMLFVYCIGAMIGPITASAAMARFDGAALLFHNGIVHAGFVVYVLWRIVRREPALMRVNEPVTLRSVTS